MRKSHLCFIRNCLTLSSESSLNLCFNLHLKFMEVVQPEPDHIFSPNYKDMFNPRGSRDYKVLGISIVMTVLMTTLFKIFHS